MATILRSALCTWMLAAGLGSVAGCAFDGSGSLVAADASGGVDARRVADASGIDDAATTADAAGSVDAAAAFCRSDDADLVACWEFEADVVAAQPHDGSQYGNDGTATDVEFVPGQRGLALSVSPGSVVHIDDSASLDVRDQFTIELWLYPRAIPTTGRAGILDDDGQYGIFLHPGGDVQCVTGIGAVQGGPITADAWTQLVCVYDGTRMALYRDGVEVAAVAASGALSTAGTSGLALGHNSPVGDPFDGLLDSVRIWRTAQPKSSD